MVIRLQKRVLVAFENAGKINILLHMLTRTSNSLYDLLMLWLVSHRNRSSPLMFHGLASVLSWKTLAF